MVEPTSVADLKAFGGGGGDGATPPKRSTERRLRKMSQEFPPTAFSFHVQARVLCVGMAVVYRVAITMTTTTTCVIAQQPNNSNTPVPGSSCQAWVIAMSQSKFRTFYSQVRAILQQPAVSEYHAQRNDSDWKPFERFLQMLTDALDQYEHLQTAFAIHADVETLNEGKVALEAFLTDCWSALEIIIPSLAVEPHFPAASLGREILCIYVLMRDFLAFPECILEANCIYASAILSLEDVEELLPTLSEHACSICLERLTFTATRDLNPSSSSAGATGGANAAPAPSHGDGDGDANDVAADCAATMAVKEESAFSVKLPCAHLFHENCIMAWLRHNPTCPECRASVGVR